MKLAIIDDELKSIKVVSSYLAENPHYEVVGRFTNPRKALDELKDLAPDVILLDIEMPEMSGFELVEQLDIENCNVIFVTAYEQYAIQAIKCAALDYILKPFSAEELISALTRAENLLENGNLRKQLLKEEKPKYIIIPGLNAYTKVEFTDIIYAEGQRGGYTTFYLTNGSRAMASKPLAFYQDVLAEFFVKIHKSHIINLHEMLKFHSSKFKVEMKDGTILDLAHRRKPDFLKVLREFM